MRCDAMRCDATGDSGTVASPSVSRCTDSVSARTAILIPFANAIAIQLQFSSHSHSGSRRLSLPLSCVKLGNGFVCRYSPLSTLHSPLTAHHLPTDKLCTSYFDVTFLQLLYIFRLPVNPKSFSLCFEVNVLVKLWWWLCWCCDLTIVYSVDVVGFLCNLWLDCHN